MANAVHCQHWLRTIIGTPCASPRCWYDPHSGGVGRSSRGTMPRWMPGTTRGGALSNSSTVASGPTSSRSTGPVFGSSRRKRQTWVVYVPAAG